ncbi:hypothetical protein [Myxococcus sp. RHSTA-1-4]|uniref:hypothetical protein n=1 Tax=Myxococcus sp. RHSTA-1-4 TaxID=2874601 RepID=UPI001CBEF9E1|nr:hypothetical protein [Myxococcus sp. RHSTA-1-4]MBZ4419359.1 hypothetical protein [Myxococcus sp. RHSTA-1-4]
MRWSKTLSPVARSAVASLAVLLLTSVHHAYGAFIYRTPWRLHMVAIAAVTAVVLLGALAVLRARPGGWTGGVALAVFALTTLGVPVGMIGVFEGAYNHVLKNVFYFGGASPELLGRLFPPPTYELPNDFLFELTGVLQVVPAVLAAVFLVHAFRGRRQRLTGAGLPEVL